MEEVIKEGALRLLTSEASCDVVLSCQGQRLMAHKVMLSIASPILQDLLLNEESQPAVLIFPDTDGNTMSLVLDYIYTGSVSVVSSMLEEFLEIATLLKLKVNQEGLKQHKADFERNHDYDIANKAYNSHFDTYNNVPYNNNNNNNVLSDDVNTNLRMQSPTTDCYSKKSLRKLPDLMPIAVLRRRKEFNKVFPSPWCPRIVPMLADPRTDHVNAQISPTIEPLDKYQENDTNNNFRMTTPLYPKPLYPKTFFQPHFLYPPKENSHLNSYSDHFTMLPPLPLPPLPPHPFSFENTLQSKIMTPLMEPLNLLPNLEKLRPDIIRDTNVCTSLEMHNVQKLETVSPVKSEDCNLTIDVVKTEDIKSEEKEEKIKPFKCQDCGKTFSQLRNFKYHRSIHEGTNEFSARCLECGKLFNDRGYLSSHMKIHRDKKEYACPHCPKRFNQRVAYNMHLRIHTGVKPHECTTCGKSFSRKMLLKQHQRVHTGERPYSCPECGKSFADRSNMSLHARLHTGIKPYACTLCPKSFTKKHHLKTHMNFHTGLKPYSCQKCGLSFSQSSNMRTHYKKCILKPNIEKPTEPATPANTNKTV